MNLWTRLSRPLLTSLLLSAFLSTPLWADDLGTLLNPEARFSLPSGAVFNVPMGWTAQPKGNFYVLNDPEQKVTLVIAEVVEMDGQDAIVDAWKAYDPSFSHPIYKTLHYLKNEEWEERYREWYFVGSADNPYRASKTRGFYAISKKKNRRWYVGLMDYDVAAADKRDAQVEVILSSLKMAGDKDKPTPTPAANQLDAKFLKDFEDFLEQARTRCKVPGAAVAIVKDGKIVYEKGFGVRQMGQNDPVTPKTLFSVASMTKPLTSLLMARLVDAGKFTWDTPVTRIMPQMGLADPKLTGQLTVKTTVCACAGLPRQDIEMVFPGGGYSSPEDVIQKLKGMTPTTGFGETFQYSNIMVAAGGFAAAHAVYPQSALGEAYATALQEYVLKPLGMADTTLDLKEAQQKEFASPHCYDLDHVYKPTSVTYNNWIVPVAPAAGIWSNVEDYAKYMMMELSKGLGADGTRVVSEANLLKRRQPQARMSDTESYGLGLVVEDSKGVSVVSHGGNSMGYSSDMFFLPERNLGVVLMTNADYAGLFTGTVRTRFMELVTGREKHAQDDLDKSLLSQKERKEKLDQFIEKGAESWVYPFQGAYYNEALGPVTIAMTQEGGVFDTGNWKSHLAGYVYGGETNFYLMDPPLAWAWFFLKDQEGHKTMTYKTPQKDYVFERIGSNK